MITLFTGTLLLSLIHGLIPSHWLPELALKEKFAWPAGQTIRVAMWAAVAHSLSTVILGVLLGLSSLSLADNLTRYTRWAVPILLVLLGIYFIFQHHRHH